MNHERLLLIYDLLSIGVLLVVGTAVFKTLEGWHTIDAFYFTAMTMLTVGYGDIAPHSYAGKMAAVCFAFLSVGIALYTVNLIARLAFRQRLEDMEWMTTRRNP